MLTLCELEPAGDPSQQEWACDNRGPAAWRAQWTPSLDAGPPRRKDPTKWGRQKAPLSFPPLRTRTSCAPHTYPEIAKPRLLCNISLTQNRVFQKFSAAREESNFYARWFAQPAGVTHGFQSACHKNTPCGTRARNLRIRSPTPCPLGQGGQ